MQTESPSRHRHLQRGLAMAFLVGGALFVGAVAASAVIDQAVDGGPVAALADARRLVSLIGRLLILPGILVALSSGLAMAVVAFGRVWPRWAVAAAALGVLIVAVALAAVMPALDMATGWAIRSAADGVRHAEYDLWLGRESAWGGLNLALFAVIAGLMLWKPSLGRR